MLESVQEEGQDKAEWNMRMAYGYQYLYGQEEKAIPYARRWAELDPEDENAPAVIQECKAEIRKRRHSRNKKAKFVPGDTPFEGFDLTNFWDDNWYALKEYVSDPPSDDLIASVEEELGYKLPASYIWLMKQHNGGIPVNTCYPCDEPTCWAEDHVAITGIFGIGREKLLPLRGIGQPVYDRRVGVSRHRRGHLRLSQRRARYDIPGLPGLRPPGRACGSPCGSGKRLQDYPSGRQL